MSFIFRSQGFIVHPHRQTVEINGEEIQIRSKTFALLLALLEKPREVLTKEYLINRIWDDVKVEEQVLVQSIRELRQLLGDSKIIQTYPRKGYAWAADVSKIPWSHEELIQTAPSPEIVVSNYDRPKKPWLKFLVGGLFVAVSLVILIGYQIKRQNTSEQTAVIVVLPIKNRIEGTDHDWVPLGGMDYLIRQLVSNKNTQVMPTEYVLKLMEYANLPRNYESQDATKIFDVSGATLVVESEIAGNVEDYELTYKLRFKNDVKRGVIYEKEFPRAMSKLAQYIVEQTGQQLGGADANAESALTNELMARAQEKMQLREYAAAETILSSTKQMDPNNSIVHEKLVEVLVRSQKYEDAKREIDSALSTGAREVSQNRIALLFWRGVMLWQTGDSPEALKSLAEAQSAAEAANDFLFLSRIAEVSGRVLEQQNEFSRAETYFEQALKFDKLIRCPMGMSTNHINLAKVLFSKGDKPAAEKHLQAAESIIKAHQFTDMYPLLESARTLK